MRPLIKIHGGKAYLHKWIISKFPSNYTELMYCEPCVGGGSILLNKKPSIMEIAGDANKDLIRLWKVVRDDCHNLHSALSMLEYSEKSFKECLEIKPGVKQGKIYPTGENNTLILACMEYAIRRMSRGGLMKDFSWSERLRGGIPGDKNGWLTSLQNIKPISDRIQNVKFVHQTLLETLEENNCNDTFAYIDPPYVHSTRVSKDAYGYNEMSDADHKELLKRLVRDFRGKFMISGYASALYDKYLSNCTSATRSVVNHAAQSKKKQKKLEHIWMNY